MSYFCIVNLPGVPVREIAAVRPHGDAAAREALAAFAAAWPGYETIELYEGERAVFVLANPAFGFVSPPPGRFDQAA